MKSLLFTLKTIFVAVVSVDAFEIVNVWTPDISYKYSVPKLADAGEKVNRPGSVALPERFSAVDAVPAPLL